MHRCFNFAHDVGSQVVLRNGAARIKSDTPLGCDRRARGSWNSVGYLQAPMIPGLTDSEAPAIARAAAEAGATFAGYVALRLPFAVKSLFEQWLEQHFPERKEKVLN